MQRARIAKSIGLIGLAVAFLLLSSAQSFRSAPKLYRAKGEDVPPWAEQGNFKLVLSLFKTTICRPADVIMHVRV